MEYSIVQGAPLNLYITNRNSIPPRCCSQRPTKRWLLQPPGHHLCPRRPRRRHVLASRVHQRPEPATPHHHRNNRGGGDRALHDRSCSCSWAQPHAARGQRHQPVQLRPVRPGIVQVAGEGAATPTRYVSKTRLGHRKHRVHILNKFYDCTNGQIILPIGRNLRLLNCLKSLLFANWIHKFKVPNSKRKESKHKFILSKIFIKRSYKILHISNSTLYSTPLPLIQFHTCNMTYSKNGISRNVKNLQLCVCKFLI